MKAKSLLLAAASWSAVAMPVHAQEADQAPAAAAETRGSGGLEDIVVTARRRAESIQDAPLSITAMTGELAAKSGIQTSADLAQVTPGLTFNVNLVFAQPYIRGIGTDITPPGAESSVSTYIDDVYQSFPVVGVQVLNAVDRIEVLKGPQGTLYGRNATGGAINIQTLNPGREFAANADISYGNYDAVQFHGYMSAPLGEKVAANIAVATSDRDGFGRVLNQNVSYNSEQYRYVRGKIQVDATEALSFRLTGYYFHRDDDGFSAYNYTKKFGSLPLQEALGGRVTELSQDVYAVPKLNINIKDYGGNFRTMLDLGDATITSVTAYQKMRSGLNSEFLSTDVPIFNFTAVSTGKSFTQDIFAQGSVGKLTYTVGGGYLNSTAAFDPLNVFIGAAPPVIQRQFIGTRVFTSYGEATYDMGSGFSLTGGVRYSNERKTQKRQTTEDQAGNILASTPVNSRTFKNVTVKALAQYKFDDTMLYAKFETGFKSGTAVASVPFAYVPPEKIKSVEGGIKTEFLDGRARLNAAAFYYDYSNLQQQYTDTSTGQALLESADKARIWGGEINFDAKLGRDLTFTSGVSLLGSKYVEFISSGAFVPNTILVGPGAPGNASVTTDVAGNKLVRTPPITVNAGLNFDTPVRDNDRFTATVNIAYSDSYFFDVTNRIKQSAYALINASAEYTFNERFSVGVFGRNLTDKKYLAIAVANNFGDQAQIGPPMTYGVKLGVKF